MNSILEVSEDTAAVVASVKVSKFDLDKTTQLRKELDQFDHSDKRPLLLNMTDVAFLPSATLGTLVALANACREARRPLALVRLQPKVKEMLEMCALDQVLTIHTNEQEAIAAF